MARHLLAASLAAACALLLGSCGGGDEGPGADGDPVSTAAAEETSAKPTSEHVEVNDHDVYVRCWGAPVQDEPSVLLMSGAELVVESWLPMAEHFAAEGHHVCGYDRAGIGGSELLPTDARRTVADQVSDLRALLSEIGLIEPVVIAAHSAGVLPLLELVATAPEQVAGVVLVDPLPPRLSIVQRSALPPEHPGESAALQEERRFLDDYYRHPAQNPERLLLARDDAHVVGLLEQPGPLFGDLPLVVVQAQLPARPDGLPRSYIAATEGAINAGMVELSSESTRGELVHVPDSGHMVMADQPDVVMQALRDVLAG